MLKSWELQLRRQRFTGSRLLYLRFQARLKCPLYELGRQSVWYLFMELRLRDALADLEQFSCTGWQALATARVQYGRRFQLL